MSAQKGRGVRFFSFVLLAILSLTMNGSGTLAQEATPVGPTDVILATTTSTQDSGLLDVLVPMFEEQTGYSAQTDRGWVWRGDQDG